MAYFNYRIHAIQPEIMNDIETVLDYVERWNKNDEEKEVAEAAARVETYLATYKATEEV